MSEITEVFSEPEIMPNVEENPKFQPTTKLTLQEVHAYLRRTGALGDPPPGIPTIRKWVIEGHMQSTTLPNGNLLVYESSFEEFLKRFEPTDKTNLAS